MPEITAAEFSKSTWKWGTLGTPICMQTARQPVALMTMVSGPRTFSTWRKPRIWGQPEQARLPRERGSKVATSLRRAIR